MSSSERAARPHVAASAAASSSSTPSAFLAWMAVVFVVALVPRLYVAFALGAEAVWDGHYYDFGARRIAAGFGYSDDLEVGGRLVWHPWCHYPVGYSAFLAAFYKVFGATRAVAAIVDSTVSALVASATYALARSGLSEGRARAAGLLVALHPGLVLYAALVMTEPLSSLLALVAFAIVSHRSRREDGEAPSWARLAAGALVLGAATLVRPQALLCAPLLGLFTTPRARGSISGWARRALPRAAFACALTLAPVLPWTARNCRVMDGCALVSTNGGWNLAIGSFPRATGRFETLRSSDGCREVTGQVQQDRCWFAYGKAQIAAAPGRFLGLVPKKLAFTFDHESFAVEYLREARPDLFPEERRLALRGAATWAHRLLVVLATLGLVNLGVFRASHASDKRARATQAALGVGLAVAVALAFTRDAPAMWPLALLVAALPFVPLPGRPRFTPGFLLAAGLLASTIVVHAVFFGEDRYHVVVSPVFALFAAAAFRREGSSS